MMQEDQEWIESPEGWGPENARHQPTNDDDGEEMAPNSVDLFGSDPRETFRYDRVPGTMIVLAGYKLDSEHTDRSTGVTLWQAATLLADYLVEFPELVRNQTVLELGAGLGLCGLVAHHLGAARTVVTDGDKYALEKLRFNVQQNPVSSSCNHHHPTGSIECRRLLWGKTVPSTKVTLDDDDDKFDVILGADVIYGWDSFEPLLDTVVAWMKHTTSSSQFLLSWKTRYNGVPVDTIKSAARDRNLSWTDVADGIYSLRLDDR
jgi:predicted nicotinamide N-methyase